MCGGYDTAVSLDVITPLKNKPYRLNVFYNLECIVIHSQDSFYSRYNILNRATELIYTKLLCLF